ncbi:MAG TPA: ABC transporter permease [Candidatus Limnocylindrales bacterium]|nr:ABC transporter permease [Candidatus Limnocylindrales bacterium]
MEFLYDIPLLGYVFQAVAYLVDQLATTNLPARTLQVATPLALGALCGVMCERSGIVNIGIEGMMLTSAFVGFMVAMVIDEAMPDFQPWPVFGATPALLIGVLAAILAGMAVSALHAWLSISVRADQIISGTAIIIISLGLTGYLNRLISPSGSAGTFDSFQPPEALEGIPVIGWLFENVLSVGPISLSVLVFVVVLQVLLFRSRWGLRTRAVGEHPRAADTVGVDVYRLRYKNVILGGIFAGLAGAWLTMEANASFQNGMTANRGFIALAAVIFGRWTPLGAFGGALLFGFSEAIGIAIRSDPPPGDLGTWLSGIQAQYPSLYNNAFSALPYILTIIVLAGVVGRSIPPAAVGRPYVKEGAS